jgi:hypothetical protein
MEITVQRNEFMDNIHNLLTSIGFTNTNGVYEWDRQVQQRGQTIVINGQRMDQPGQTIIIPYRIEIIGDGCVMAEDDNIEQEFTQIRFEVNGDIHEECFKWDDFAHFENILKQIIR